MASPYYNKFMDETLGSDPNGNQKTWQNLTTPGFQPMGWGVQPISPRPWEQGWGNAIGSFFSGLVPQQQPMSVFPEFIPQGNPPPQGTFGGVPYGPKQPVNPINPLNKPYNRTQPTIGIMSGSLTPPVVATNAKPRQESQRNGLPYATPKPNIPPGSTGAVGYGKYVESNKQKYNLGPGQKYQQFIKNGAIYAKNSADMKTLWQNYRALDNWPKAPVQPNTGGGTGGYDYGWYGGGGGGYSRPKYAENLPGAVWRINQ